MPPTAPTDAIALFDRVCVQPFPNPASFDKAVAGLGSEFVKWQPTTQIEAIIPGGYWQSPRFTIRYVAAAPDAPELPHPQCTVKAAAAAGTQAEAIFPVVAQQLGLGKGKIVGKAKYRTAMWDSMHGADRWRVLAGTERQEDHVDLKLIMMNLGSKK